MKLGILNVDDMLRSMTVRQFNEWRAYGEIEPFDEVRADLRSAQLVQSMLNTFGRGRRREPFPLKDCLLRFGVESGPATGGERDRIKQQVMGAMSMLMAANGQKER